MARRYAATYRYSAGTRKCVYIVLGGCRVNPPFMAIADHPSVPRRFPNGAQWPRLAEQGEGLEAGCRARRQGPSLDADSRIPFVGSCFFRLLSSEKLKVARHWAVV